MRRVVGVLTIAVLATIVGASAPGVKRTARLRETFTVGMLRVDHFGTAGRTPIIFIPALFCGASQWQRQIAELADRYDIYALTLPGFDGRARDAGDHLVSRAIADIASLIETRHLDHPIVVGHSLGGTLAIVFAVAHSAEARGIIAVEGGYPVAPTAERREEHLRETIAPYVGIARAMFGDALNEHMLPYVITSKSDADSVALVAGRSDPAAVVDWLKEVEPLDLTAQLSSVTVPLEEIVPFDGKMDPYQGFASYEGKRASYLAFLAHAPRGSLSMIDHSRHFVMIDQPSAFDHALYAAIDADDRGS